MDDRSEADERWRHLVAVREEAELALPRVVSRIDGRPREASADAISLARALQVTDAWSGISEARRRHERRAA